MREKNSYFIVGTLCIFLASLLFLNNLYEDYRVSQNTQKIVETLLANELSNLEHKKKYLENPHMEMPIKTIDGQDYIGYLKLEKLGLHLPIISEWSYEKIKIAPARYQGSAYLKNMVLLAHNYQSHFGKLERLELGDRLYFSDMDGNDFRYKVTSKEEISGDDVTKLLDGNWDLTLFTCTLSGEFRTVIRCEVVNAL